MPGSPGLRTSAARRACSATGSATHGTVERTVMEVVDDSAGVSGSVRAVLKSGGSYKRIKVHRKLLEATARTGGAERDRFDCVG